MTNFFKKYLKEKNAIILVIVLLWFSVVIDTTGYPLHIRDIAIATGFCVIFYYGLYRNFFTLLSVRKNPEIFFLIGVMPIYGFLIYLIRGCCDSIFLDKSYLLFSILLLLSLILYKDKKTSIFSFKIFLIALRLLAFFEIATLLDWMNKEHSYEFFILMKNNIGYIDRRNYSNIYSPYIYYLPSPLLIYLCAYDLMNLLKKLNKRNIFYYTFSICALFVSGTRAHMLIAILFTPLYLIINNIRWKNIVIYTISTSIIFTIFYQFDQNYITSIFSKNEYSNSMKIGYLKNYFLIFSQNQNLLIGQGFNAQEWSAPLKSMLTQTAGATKTELTYVEVIRVFGVFIGIIFLFSLVMIAKNLKNIPQKYNLEFLYPGFVIYLINCSINPYLISSIGALPLGLFLALAVQLQPAKKSLPIISKAFD